MAESRRRGLRALSADNDDEGDKNTLEVETTDEQDAARIGRTETSGGVRGTSQQKPRPVLLPAYISCSSPKHLAGVREGGAAGSPTPLVLEGEGIGRTTGRGGGLLDGARHPVYMGLGLACEENMGSIVRYHP